MAQELVTMADGEAARLHVQVKALTLSVERDSRYRDALPEPINPTQRRSLENYRRALHARLRPIGEAVAESETARAAISLFLGGYANVRADAKSISHAYIAMLLDMPLFAIMAALDDFKNHRVFDLNSDGDKIPFTVDHAPSAPRILDQAKKHIDALVDERAKVVRLLAVTQTSGRKPDDPAMAEKVGKLMAGLAADLGARSAKERLAEAEKIRAEADEARARARRIIESARQKRAAESAGAQAG